MTVYSPGVRPVIEYSPWVLVTALPPLGESATTAPCNTPPAASVARPFTEPDPCAWADAANSNAATTPISARRATFITGNLHLQQRYAGADRSRAKKKRACSVL